MHPIDFARRLSRLGHPIFVAPYGGKEFLRPPGWQDTDPAGNDQRLDDFHAGAVCAVLGRPLAVVDIDTKNDADPAKVYKHLDRVGVPILALVATPSGGRHAYVPGHVDLPTIHASQHRDGLRGLPGVEILSHGTNTFLPGTIRASGRGYEVIFDRLDRWTPAMAEQGEKLAAWAGEQRLRRTGDTHAPTPPSGPWSGRQHDERERRYLEVALDRQAAEVASCGPGSRNIALFTAAMKLGSLVAGAGLDEGAAWEALGRAADTNGLSREDGAGGVRATIRSGMRVGKTNPRSIPEKIDPLTGEVL